MTNTVRSVAIATILLAAAFAAYWRSRPDAPAPPDAPARGGQAVASIRTDPRAFHGLVRRDLTTEVVSLLTQGRLVRVNRSTFELEPWLAERWESSPDGRVHTLHLRRGVAWSDGVPFTAADVLFTLDAVFDPRVKSPLASALRFGGGRITAAAPDANTVVVTYPGPSGPGLRLLDNLTILPRHKLEPALRDGTLADAWSTRTPLGDIVGTGPFIPREHQVGQRMIFDRNPRYWRRAPDGGPLPFLDRLVLEVIPDQNAELLRLQGGSIDLIYSELRPEDYVSVRRAEAQGTLRLLELGVAADADAFWFRLKPDAWKGDPRWPIVRRREFRQAISHAIDRERFADTVFLGAAVPIWGPITPGNRRWFWPDVPRYPYGPERARELLKGIGLEDRDGNGVVEDARGTEARFTVITQQGVTSYERGTRFLRDEAAKAGIALDIVPLEFGAMLQRMLGSDYDAIYMRFMPSDLDPGLTLDFWLSSGSAHVWNLEQKAPATDWERRIDTLMIEQAATLDPERRRDIFNHVQRIFAEELPVLYFAAPRSYYAHSARVRGAVPSIQRPPVLWSADTLAVAPAARSGTQ